MRSQAWELMQAVKTTSTRWIESSSPTGERAVVCASEISVALHSFEQVPKHEVRHAEVGDVTGHQHVEDGRCVVDRGRSESHLRMSTIYQRTHVNRPRWRSRTFAFDSSRASSFNGIHRPTLGSRDSCIRSRRRPPRTSCTQQDPGAADTRAVESWSWRRLSQWVGSRRACRGLQVRGSWCFSRKAQIPGIR